MTRDGDTHDHRRRQPIRVRETVEILFFEDSTTDSILVQSYIEASASMTARLTVVDVALLDLNLPDSQGLESLERLRRAAPDLPVVAVSSALNPSLALDLLRNGAQDCLLKGPGLEVMLASAVRYAIERQQAAAELAAHARRLAASEARIHTVVDASADAIFVVSRLGAVRFVNRAAEKMFGRTAAELMAQPFAFSLQDSNAKEVEITRPDGGTTLAEMSLASLEWDSQPAHLASLRDITERKRMEVVLVNTEKMRALGTLAAGIAHDFNNILLTISGNAKLALADLPADHAARSSVLEIAKAGSRAVALTRKILSFSRHDAAKRQPDEVQSAIAEALSLLRSTLPARLEIRQAFSPRLPPISADPALLNQVLINLATNSVDAIGDQPGVLEISATRTKLNGNGSTFSSRLLPGPYVKISIKDSGPGMDKPTLGRIFEPFFTTKSQGRGTGMGLAIVHGIMKDHLGEVTAYSELGKGTVFNLYFPAQNVAADVQPASAIPVVGVGRRIMYVDDEEPLVMLITRTLKRLGYEVHGFVDPVEALKTFQQHPHDFDAIVTDLSMPGLSVTDLAREVKEIRRDIPIVLTSGYIRPQDQEVAKQVGVLDLILKPDTVEDLGDTLNRLLAAPAKSAAASG